jgi:hypothetical protein
VRVVVTVNNGDFVMGVQFCPILVEMLLLPHPAPLAGVLVVFQCALASFSIPGRLQRSVAALILRVILSNESVAIPLGETRL